MMLFGKSSIDAHDALAPKDARDDVAVGLADHTTTRASTGPHRKQVRGVDGCREQIDTYIMSHSDALFSHGACAHVLAPLPVCGPRCRCAARTWFTEEGQTG